MPAVAAASPKNSHDFFTLFPWLKRADDGRTDGAFYSMYHDNRRSRAVKPPQRMSCPFSVMSGHVIKAVRITHHAALRFPGGCRNKKGRSKRSALGMNAGALESGIYPLCSGLPPNPVNGIGRHRYTILGKFFDTVLQAVTRYAYSLCKELKCWMLCYNSATFPQSPPGYPQSLLISYSGEPSASWLHACIRNRCSGPSGFPFRPEAGRACAGAEFINPADPPAVPRYAAPRCRSLPGRGPP